MENDDVRMDLMSSKDVQVYLRKNDLVILPVGCFEMHGPDIPLGCDSFIDWAAAVLLAREWKCITLPPIYYSFPGASGPWPGTIDIPVDVTQSYVSAVAQSLIKNGFKRIVLVSSHGPMGFMLPNVIRDIFQKTGEVVIHLSTYQKTRDEMTKAGLDFGEDGVVLGSLKVMGHHGVYDPASKVDRPGELPFESMGKLRQLGINVPWTFNKDYQHTGLRKKLKLSDAGKIVTAMKKACRCFKDVPKNFAMFQQDMKKLYKDKPWEKPGIWTRTK